MQQFMRSPSIEKAVRVRNTHSNPDQLVFNFDDDINVDIQSNKESTPATKELCFPDIKERQSGLPIILNTSDNLAALLEFEGYEACINQMTLEPEIFHSGHCIGSPESIRSKIISLCSIHGLPKASIDDHFNSIAQDKTYHPVLQWLEKNSWDGINRVDRVIGCLKTKEPDVTAIILKRWLVGCIASLIVPRFKSKLIPILTGEQSYGKTSFIERIAAVTENSFLEGAELNPDNKDSVLSCIRSWITELGELERTTVHSQGALKAFVTKSIDTVRPPYARIDIKKPRQTSLIASVNGSNFLRDQTGNSRYAVIELDGKTDMDQLNELLGWRYHNTGELTLVDEYKLRQFWLEVRHLLEVEQFSWNLTPEELTEVAQLSQKFVDKGDYYAVLSDHLAMCKRENLGWMTSKQVCNLVGIHVTKANMVGKALSMLVEQGAIQRKFSSGVNKYLIPLE